MIGIESVISLLTANLLAILAIFLFTYRKGNRLTNLMLGFFFTFGLIFEIQYFLNLQGIRIAYYPLYHAVNSLSYFMGPFMYFYTKSLCYKDYRFEKKSPIHFLPYFFLAAFIFIFYHTTPFIKPSDAPSKNVIISNNVSSAYFSVVTALLLIYCILSLITLAKYRRDLKNYFSSVTYKNLSWLTMVIAAYLTIWLLDMIAYLALFQKGLSELIIDSFNIVTGVVNFIIALIIVFKGLRQSDIFAGITSKITKPVGISKQKIDEYSIRIETFMTNEKPFLDPELNLNFLAERFSIPARQLSQVINVSFKQNFFDFVSDYRIAEAKRLLSDPSKKDKTILEILYDVGFNSKSSFNDLFKKKTGMTPSEFRKISLKAD